MTTEKIENRENDTEGRAAAWGILAAPLISAPNSEMLSHYATLGGLFGDERRGDWVAALRALSCAAKRAKAESAADDYQDLFIGLGRGKVVPYGSWHMSGSLMSAPLARLREDLRALGLARGAGVKEPEDHAGALCQAMAMLSADDSALSFGVQKKFFEAHMSPWLEGFFGEVSARAETPFYRAFGEFGAAFMALEGRYFSMPF